MNILRRLIILIIAIAAFAPETDAQTARGQKSLGLNMGYATRNESLVAGLGFTYAFQSHFRINPSVAYVFKNQNKDCASINFDFEMPYQVINSKWYVYPLVGFSYTSWNYDFEGSSDRVSRLGLNLGAGAEYYFTPNMRLNLEGSANLVKHLSTGIFTIGLSYLF